MANFFKKEMFKIGYFQFTTTRDTKTKREREREREREKEREKDNYFNNIEKNFFN